MDGAMSAADVPKESPWGLGALLRRPAVDTSDLARLFGEMALTVGSVLGVVIAGLTVTAAHNGIRPLVVRSGSMEPTIPTGSMVLVKRVEAADIKVGDVMTVERPDHTRVTHRVVAIERNGVTALLTLKGDANEDPDPVPIPVRYAHRVVTRVPVIGRAVAWLATAPGGFLLGCLSTLVIRPMVGLRSGGGKRQRVIDLVVSRLGAAAAEAEGVGTLPEPANPFLSWVGVVVEERMAERRSQVASPIHDWTASHAA
jgi:signal peptidase